MNSGLFIDMGPAASAVDCLEHCCRIDACDLAFLTRDRCYAVDCYSAELCEPVAAPDFVTDKPSLYYVTKNGKSIINQGQYLLKFRGICDLLRTYNPGGKSWYAWPFFTISPSPPLPSYNVE